jgi:hypothetical protein
MVTECERSSYCKVDPHWYVEDQEAGYRESKWGRISVPSGRDLESATNFTHLYHINDNLQYHPPNYFQWVHWKTAGVPVTSSIFIFKNLDVIQSTVNQQGKVTQRTRSSRDSRWELV